MKNARTFIYRLFSFGLIILTFLGNGKAQDFVSATLLNTYDKSYFLSEFGLFAQNGVELYRLNYTTKDLEGKIDTASGLVVIPDIDVFTYSVVAYHHGTVGSRFDVPSYESFESTVPMIYAGFGFISIAPDYIGLGDSKVFHPYIHAESEAWATRDMLIAAETLYKEKELSFKRRIMISGYSQGGHAGMAAHKLLEEGSEGFDVVATAHMSGPYDISNAMTELLLADGEYPLVSYMPYVALAYNEAYGIFDGDINNFFLPNYSELIMRFYREEIDLWTLNDQLILALDAEFGIANPAKMIVPSVLDSINSNPDHPVNEALRLNDVYDWAPNADTRLLYCGSDEQVAFQNSVTAERVMKDNGAPMVVAMNLDDNGTHASCVSPAITNSLFHFLNYRTLTNTGDIAPVKTIKAFPNPTQNVVQLEGLDKGSNYNVYVYDLSGKLVQRTTLEKGQRHLELSADKGLLMVNLIGSNGDTFSIKVRKI